MSSRRHSLALRFFSSHKSPLLKEQLQEAKQWSKGPKNTEGATLLHFAATHDYLELAEDLLQKSSKQQKLLGAVDRQRRTVADYSIQARSFRLLALLIRLNLSCDEHTVSSNALDHAIRNADEDMANVVADADPRSLSITLPSRAKPLHLAICEGKQSIATLLISKGATIDATDSHGQTPLSLATKHNSLSIVRLLVQQGAPSSEILYEAIGSGKLDVIRTIVKAAPTSIRTRHQTHGPPVHFALRKGDERVALALVDLGADINAVDDLGDTALHLGARKHYLTTIDVLQRSGASFSVRNMSGMTPLCEAVKNIEANASLIVKLVSCCSQSDLAVTDHRGYSLLHVAVEKGVLWLTETIAKLLPPLCAAAHTESPHSVCTIRYNRASGSRTDLIPCDSPLGLAVQLERYKCLQILLQHLPAYFKIHDDILQSSLTKPEFLSTMLSYPNLCGMIDASVIHASISYRPALLLFLGYGVDLNSKYNKTTLLQRVARKRDTELLRLLCANGLTVQTQSAAIHDAEFHMPTLILLLKHGADIDVQSVTGATLLECAVRQQRRIMARFLLQRGARINNGKESLVHLASPSIRILEHLLEYGADINELRNGKTLLQVAAETSDFGLVAWLLRREATSTDNIDLDALLHAAIGSPDCVRELLNRGADPHSTQADDMFFKRAIEARATATQKNENTTCCVLNLILESGVDIDCTGSQRHTALFWLVELEAENWSKKRQIIEVMNNLIDRNARLDLKNKVGSNVLVHAASKASVCCFEALLEAAEGDTSVLQAKNMLGRNALHYLALNGMENVMELFMKHCGLINDMEILAQGGKITVPDPEERSIRCRLYDKTSTWLRDTREKTPLHLAVEKQRHSVVVKLLKHTYDMMIPLADADGRTALHQTAKNGDLRMTKYLLAHGALVSVLDRSYGMKKAPVNYAIEEGHIALVEELGRRHLEEGKSEEGREMLLWAIGRSPKRNECVSTILKLGVNPNHGLAESGATGVFTAVEAGDKDLLMIFVRHGADLRAQISSGRSLVARAAQLGTPAGMDILEFLVDHGAPCSEPSLENINQTPLQAAVHFKNLSLVRKLLRAGANPNESTKRFRQQPLELAITRELKDIAAALLWHNADPDATAQQSGAPPLHLALAMNMEPTAVLLVQQGADMYAKTKGGLSVLELALRGKHNLLIGEMLRGGLDPNTVLDGKGRIVRQMRNCGSKSTPKLRRIDPEHFSLLMYCIILNMGPTAGALLERGADAHATNGGGRTALFYAISRAESINLKLVRQLLLLSSADPTMTFEPAGLCALHVAVKRGNKELLEALLRPNRANIDIREERKGWTPLALAVIEGFEEGISMLAQKGADVNVVDHEGDTPLLTALLLTESSTASKASTVHVLVRFGADVNKSNKDGVSPMEVALSLHQKCSRADEADAMRIIKCLLGARDKIEVTENMLAAAVLCHTDKNMILDMLIANGVTTARAYGPRIYQFAEMKNHAAMFALERAWGGREWATQPRPQRVVELTDHSGHKWTFSF